ncbi:MAG: ABC transporter ATP-binding protein, partial [Alphaproteobacteria bacterium]
MGALDIAQLSRPGLDSVDAHIGAGECLVVSGPSGSGKTLFLRALADLDPNSGRVTLDNQARGAIPAPQWRRRVVYVPAEPGWWADICADHFPDWDAAKPILDALLLSQDLGAAPIARLSTGERQRLALARALMLAPSALLLDEPTGALDPAATAAVETLLRARLESGMCLIVTTHDAAQATRL